jgi:hypothetical protein
MNKTTQLVKLLEKRSIDPANPHGYVAGYLTGVLKEMENEYKSAQRILDEHITFLLKKGAA